MAGLSRWLSIFGVAALTMGANAPAAVDGNIPRYDHIIVIIEENHSYDQIIGNPDAPNLNRLARTYGLASNFYGEVHPSEPNYVAMIGGSTFGIRDDDAWYCGPGSDDPYCPNAKQPDYAKHTIFARSLVNQLDEHGLTWKGYYESIPAAGSMAVYHPAADTPVPGMPNQLYASKHNGFMNFAAVQSDPDRGKKIVGLDRLSRDLANGEVPNYAHVVPNQCNEMHGLTGPDVPDDCLFKNDRGRIARADAVIGKLVGEIQASSVWSGPGNTAIIVTWDEDDNPKVKTGTQGCCGYDPASAANFGGGHIPTIVITNHGPRGVADDTSYNHYSLLRTIEEAFGIHEYLNHANDTAAGVRSLNKLFAAP